MRKKIILSGCLLFCSILIMQGQQLTKPVSFGFGFEIGLPTSDIKKTHKFTSGGTLKLSVHAGPGFVTLSSGAIIFAPKNTENQDVKIPIQIPIKAGYKYLVTDNFFVAGEAGASIFKYYIIPQTGDRLIKKTATGFTFAPIIGVQFRKTELSFRYETIQLSDGNVSYVGLRFGSNF